MMDTRDEEPGALAAAALRRVARDERIKEHVQGDAALYVALLKAAMRFIEGETLPECLEVAAGLNAQGHAATVDYMGESTRNEAMAREATEEFLRVVRAISDRGLDSSVSLDLSHVGLAVDPRLGFENASEIAGAAGEAGLEVMISAEGSERTDGILATHERLCERHHNVGITLQVYLLRTPDDLERALERPGRVRLVKGAYEEPEIVALARGPEVDAAYQSMTETLLASGHACSISTHDPALLEHAHSFLRENGPDLGPVEFDMLRGVCPERLRKMRDLGYGTRTYLPYGREWYLYLCHRLAEHPPNLYKALADAVGITE